MAAKLSVLGYLCLAMGTLMHLIRFLSSEMQKKMDTLPLVSRKLCWCRFPLAPYYSKSLKYVQARQDLWPVASRSANRLVLAGPEKNQGRLLWISCLPIIGRLLLSAVLLSQ
jgi:hypothetical protein